MPVQYQPSPLPPITDLLRDIDESWLAPPDAFGISPLEEAIASEVTDDVFLGLPGSSFMMMMEDARTPSLSSYDALQSPFIPDLPILAEDATSSSFPLAESLPPLPALVDFSSWPGSTDAMYDPEVDATPPWSSRLHEEYEYSTTVDFSSWPESTDAMYDPGADAVLSLSLPPPWSSRLHDEEDEYPTAVPSSSFPGLVPFDSDTRDFEWAQEGQRESERDSWVDRESYEDACSMRCPRCGRSASPPPLDPFVSWPQWLFD